MWVESNVKWNEYDTSQWNVDRGIDVGRASPDSHLVGHERENIGGSGEPKANSMRPASTTTAPRSPGAGRAAIETRLARPARRCCSEPMSSGARGARLTPLSHTQQYFLDVLVDEGFEPTWQHLVAAFEFPVELDAAHLQAVVKRIGVRHAILNTRLKYCDGEPFLHHLDDGASHFQVFDLRGRGDAELDLVLSRFADGPFDLLRGPLWRVALARVTGKTIVMIVSHHLVSDATSGWLISRDLITDLFGGELKSTGPSYEEFVLDERSRYSGAELEGRLAYWVDLLESATPDLPLERRPTRHELSSPVVMPLSCASDAGELLRASARGKRLTPLALSTATVLTAVARAADAEDILCGVVTDVRGQRFMTTVGPFADLMLVRDRPTAGEDDAQRLARIRNSFFTGWAQHVPMALLQRYVPGLAARAERNPCDVFLNFLPTPPPADWDRIRALCSEAAPTAYFPRSRLGSPPRRFGAPMYLFLFNLTERLDGCIFAHGLPELSELNHAMADELAAGVADWQAPASTVAPNA